MALGTNSSVASSSLPLCWPHFSIFPHDGIFFPHLYLTNACTYTQDIYFLEILIKPFFSYYAFITKRNTTCCPPYGIMLEEEEERKENSRKE
jgi:hypothetical protein